jgi:hypothetical protein
VRRASWYWPVSLTHLTAAGAGPLADVISKVAATDSLGPAASAAGLSFYSEAMMSSQLPGLLGQVQAQLATIESLDDLVIGGLFAAPSGWPRPRRWSEPRAPAWPAGSCRP